MNYDTSLVSFDLDNTIVFQNSQRKYELLRQVISQSGRDVSLDSVLCAIKTANNFYEVDGYRFASDPSRLWYEYAGWITKTIGHECENLIEAICEFYKSYNRTRNNFFVPRDARSLLVNLKKAGLRLAIVSSNLEAEHRVALCELGDSFEYVLSPSSGIPKTELFGFLLRSKKLLGSSCIHIGDDPLLDIEAPRRYEIRSILFDPNSRHTSRYPVTVCRTYAEIENTIFQHPELC